MRHVGRMSGVLAFVAIACLLQPAYPQKQKPQFKVQVNLVSLDVEVLDQQGQPVDKLDQNDFVVKENGSAVEISNFSRLSDLSLSLVVSLQTSFMQQANMGIAKDAIFQLIHLLKPEDEICLYSFDQKDAYLEQAFTRNRSKLVDALDNIGVTSRSRRPNRLVRGFAIPPQTGLGVDLGLAAAKKGVYRRKALLFIGDRVQGLGPATLEHVQESGCALIALGFSEEAKERLMLISDQSGSEQLILGAGEEQASDDKGNVTELCRTIAHLLTSRYSITYHTSLPESASARHIEVLVPGHDYRVLARRSYVTPR
jgi:VWFA-related protein